MTHQRALACMTAVVAVIAGAHTGGADVGLSDPFAFFQPVVALDAVDRERLKRGDVIVRVLPGHDEQLGMFAASKLEAPAESLVAWTHAIAALKQSTFVLAIRRFSDVPVLEDLDQLVLDDGDVEAIRRCRVGDCGLKLAADEVQLLRTAAGTEKDWRAAIRQEFKRVVLNRVVTYRAAGLTGLPPYADRREPASPEAALAAILSGSFYLTSQLPDVAARLQGYPGVDIPGVESFVYWSKEQYGAGKRVIAVTHVDIIRPEGASAPVVLVLGKEIFATHYRTGSLGVTAVVQDPVSDQRYLVYVNRSQVDLLKGLFGGLKRRLIEGRLASESAALIKAVRRKLESGLPASLPPQIGEGET